MEKSTANRILTKGYRLSLSQTSVILIDDCEIRDKERPNASCKWEYIEITNEDLINLAKIKLGGVVIPRKMIR